MLHRYGADAVLLIASVLPNKDLALMLKVAKTVGLQCLIEVHNLHQWLDWVHALKRVHSVFSMHHPAPPASAATA